MKTFIFLLTATFFSLFRPETNAQTIQRFVISSSGSNLSNGNYAINYTIGETVTQTFTQGEQLSQGFQQTWATVTAVDDPAAQLTEVNVFPNPTFGRLTIQSKEELLLHIVDANGKLIRTEKIESGDREINISQQPAGMYYLFLASATTEQRKTYKLTKLD